jgi:hypothetical protein
MSNQWGTLDPLQDEVRSNNLRFWMVTAEEDLNLQEYGPRITAEAFKV